MTELIIDIEDVVAVRDLPLHTIVPHALPPAAGLTFARLQRGGCLRSDDARSAVRMRPCARRYHGGSLRRLSADRGGRAGCGRMVALGASTALMECSPASPEVPDCSAQCTEGLHRTQDNLFLTLGDLSRLHAALREEDKDAD